MKKSLFAILLIVLFAGLSSCENGGGNMTRMNEMKDSIFAAYPDIAAVTINVQNNNHLLIAIGSQSLYDKDASDKQHVANELAAMAMRIFGKNNKIETGRIIVTANETNQDPEPADGISTDMDIKAARENL